MSEVEVLCSWCAIPIDLTSKHILRRHKCVYCGKHCPHIRALNAAKGKPIDQPERESQTEG